MAKKIVVIPGDGIGSEITDSAVEVLKKAAEKFSLALEYEYKDAGGTAYDKFGTPLPEDTLEACKAADGVLFGAVGGDKWDNVEPSLRPEKAILGLRKGLGLYANLRPVKVADALVEYSPLKQELVKGVDLVIVRELVGGISKFLQDRKEQVIAALGLKNGDFVGLTAGKKLDAQKTAGVLRKFLGLASEKHMKQECYEFCWIVDFPMYEIGEESGELEFCHNPFSMPQGGMDALLNKDPLDIYAYQYDLVCNGVELSSGAVRNHDPEIMVKAFQIVGLDEEHVKAKFPAMYNAFCYGAPPHAGIAPGVDRMVMLIAGEESIREIIPFPMNKTAQDVMMGAPSEVDEKQLKDVHIKIDLK